MTPLADKHHHLAPESRARTVLATSDRVEVTAGDLPMPGVTALLSFGAELYLVGSGAGPARAEERSEVTVVCRGPVKGLGVLKLLGRRQEAVAPSELPSLAPLLARHGYADGEITTVIPVTVDQVRLLMPATDRGRAHVVTVCTDLFHAAAPDPWVFATDTLGTHLEQCHQVELGTLALRELGDRPAAAVVTDLGREALTLTCLFPDGVSQVTLRYGRRMDEVGEVAAWLRESAAA